MVCDSVVGQVLLDVQQSLWSGFLFVVQIRNTAAAEALCQVGDADFGVLAVLGNVQREFAPAKRMLIS